MRAGFCKYRSIFQILLENVYFDRILIMILILIKYVIVIIQIRSIYQSVIILSYF